MNIAVTIGDINGIGLEAFVKSLIINKNLLNNHNMSIVGDIQAIEQYINKCSLNCKIHNKKILVDNTQSVDIIDCYQNKYNHNIEFGKISERSGKLALSAIQLATQMTIDKKFDAMVTLPISKEAISLSHHGFTGHTEFIAGICAVKSHIMILFTGMTRIALATTHIPLHRVPSRITSKKLCALIRNFNISLKKDFLCLHPKIALLGLNPHSGENGRLGKEESDTIQPAINIMKNKGINVSGAYSSDSFFARDIYKNFDGIIAMYHDQGLIPLKMLAIDGGVNFTAGLPIVRTSPDHGTGFDIAGQGIANPQSTYEALKEAISIAQNRKK